MSKVLRNIPSVNELLESPPLQRLVDRASRTVVISGVRSFLDGFRKEVETATAEIRVPTPTELAQRIADWILEDGRATLREVINATGIPLHTGLGRAPWPRQAIDAVEQIARGYASVEIGLESGQRSQRVVAVEKLLRHLTGAEGAAVVNNNAGATLIVLSALAAEKEVVVSRGQLIEIGGSFRLPDVMSVCGAKLREVGTTNKTRIGDYREAIGQDTAALMRVHTSNFVVSGFVEETSLEELVDLGGKRNLPVIDDIGSGAMIDFARYGIEGEPVASASIKAGADLVLFSGDKLMGGPQCGIIVGRRDLVQKIAKHPLMRALRVDKATLAALAATLNLYLDPDTVVRNVPLLALMETPIENLRNRAERLAPQIADAGSIQTATPHEDVTYLGGGSVPTQQIRTWTIRVTPEAGSVSDLSDTLRGLCPAVMGRVQNDQMVLDLRSVFPAQDVQLVDAFQALQPGASSGRTNQEEESS